MDPNAFIASLQQNGTQFTPAQLQQLQLFQQQQQNQQQQVAPQNGDTLNMNTGNESSLQNVNNITNNNNSGATNPNTDMNASTAFQVPTQAATHQAANAPPAPVNSNANAYATNNAFQMALLGATPLHQQLAAFSGYSQQQPNTSQTANDNSTIQKQQVTDNGQAQQQQQQQQIQTWNPQMVQQQFNGVNPFMAAASGLVVPTAMNVQQLQQQFLTQQFLTQQLAAAGHNPAATGNFNLLAQLLAQSGAASAMNPATGMPNQMFQAPTMSGFPFVTAPVPSQQFMTGATSTPVNLSNVKGPNDGMKVGGEIEWTKPFAAKVKKESPFPLKLFQILGNPECQECITWNPHGRSWRILKPPVFEQVVIPLYFRYESFVKAFQG